jgi:MscS family membrane protein
MQYPDIFNRLYFGNTILQYLILFGCIAISIVIGKIIYYITTVIIRRLTSKTKTKFDDILIDIIEEPLVFLVVVVGFFIGYSQLTLTDKAAEVFAGITRTLTTIAFSWFLIRFIDSLIVNYLAPKTEKTDSDLDDHLLPIVRKIIKITIIAITFIMILSNLGFNVTSIIASLGIGGLAFAFAAQDLIANLFGGLTIIIDKPFKIGQWVEIGGHSGEVVEIGLRSSRLKTANGEYITLPNKLIVEQATINYKRYNERLITLTLGLACDTPNKKIERAKKIVEKIVTKQELYKKNSFEINFINFGDFTYDLEVRYKLKTNRAGDVRKVKDAVNSEIKKALEDEKIELAYPTQTLYLKK